jgi:plastocyanin
MDHVGSRTKRRLRLASLALACGVVLGACGGGTDGSAAGGTDGSAGGGGAGAGSKEADEGSSGTKKIAGKDANNHGTKDVSGADDADLELDDFYFEPTVLTGDPGQKITLELENEGSATHNFSLDEQKVSQDVDPGAQAEVEVTFPKSGTLLFYCKYHTSSGMNGGVQAS